MGCTHLRRRAAECGRIPSLLGLLGATLACSGPEMPGSAPDGPGFVVTTAAIAGGEVAAGAAGAVVGIYTYQNGEPAICTGSLLLPNLVLTAHHCVAETNDADDCESARFVDPLEPEALRVTLAGEMYPEVLADAVDVEGIHSPGSADQDDPVCGADLALLRLVPAWRDTPTLSPRWVSLDADESLTAVGYGSDGEVFGVRRQSAPFEVECIGNACGAELSEGEFVAGTSTLRGDSGGPALSEDGELAGVLSRHDLGLGVYQSLAPWRAWIEAVVDDAAKDGGYARPSWLIQEGAGGADGSSSAASGTAGAAGSGAARLPETAQWNAVPSCATRRRSAVGSGLVALALATLALAFARFTGNTAAS